MRHNPLMDTPFMHDWVFHHAAATPTAPAIGSLTARLSYADLAERTAALATVLAGVGIGRGDRVLVALANSPAAIVAGLAANVLGATVLVASRGWGHEALGDIASRAGATVAFLEDRDARGWAQPVAAWPIRVLVEVGAGAGVAHPTSGIDEAPGTTRIRLRLPDHGAFGGDPPAAIDDLRAPASPDEAALIVFTSGSTGRPRGVIQTFANIDANTRSIVEYLALTAADRAILTLPLSYCYGRSVLQTHLFAGASVVLDNRGAFPRSIVDAMAAERTTGFAGVPLTFELFRRHLDPAEIHLPDLRYLTQAGGPMAPDTISWVRRSFAPTPLYVMYGQTEATARLSYLPPAMAERKPGSIGIPIPGVRLEVLDEADNVVEAGVTGELAAHGKNVTPGYLDEPDATAEILRDGWLRTGDLARRDTDGYLFLEGRVREFLKIGGHRVSPVRIEQAIARHPSVAEVGVVGRPDGLQGEVAVAAVVLWPGERLDPEALRSACEPVLARHEIPADFHGVARLPRNEAGKLLRGALAAQLAELPLHPTRPPSDRQNPAGQA